MSKVSWKGIFMRIELTVVENKRTLWIKLYFIQPLWCTAKPDKFYVIFFILTKEMAQI